jgi:hypothetical protein
LFNSDPPLKNSLVKFIPVVHLLLCLCVSVPALAKEGKDFPADSSKVSTTQDALNYLQSLPKFETSSYWPSINPVYFRENLKQYLENPLSAFDNKNTNFCGYTAISFAVIEYDPLSFIKFMMTLYQTGEGQLGRAHFTPSARVRAGAGKLKYKGMLDVNPASQVWFLTLADHFKGYLNIFDKRYDAGDENKIWAATNFAKFNRMLRRLLPWDVQGRGADLVRPPIDHIYEYIARKKEDHVVFLFLNNRLLYKHKHIVAKVGFPTHYVLLKRIWKSDNDEFINILYVDGGRMTHQQVSTALLEKIVFGITFCKPKSKS